MVLNESSLQAEGAEVDEVNVETQDSISNVKSNVSKSSKSNISNRAVRRV